MKLTIFAILASVIFAGCTKSNYQQPEQSFTATITGLNNQTYSLSGKSVQNNSGSSTIPYTIVGVPGSGSSRPVCFIQQSPKYYTYEFSSWTTGAVNTIDFSVPSLGWPFIDSVPGLMLNLISINNTTYYFTEMTVQTTGTNSSGSFSITGTINSSPVSITGKFNNLTVYSQ